MNLELPTQQRARKVVVNISLQPQHCLPQWTMLALQKLSKLLKL